jgi:hypothetical protein
MKKEIKYKNLTITIVTIMVGLFFSCTSKKIIYCPPDNEPVVIYKKASKAYPSYVKTFESNLKGSIQLTKDIEALELENSIKNKVTVLRERLNQTNITWENLLKGAYMAFEGVPCDKDIRSKYFQFLENIRADNLALQELRTTLDIVTSKSNFSTSETKKLESSISKYLSNAKL